MRMDKDTALTFFFLLQSGCEGPEDIHHGVDMQGRKLDADDRIDISPLPPALPPRPPPRPRAEGHSTLGSRTRPQQRKFATRLNTFQTGPSGSKVQEEGLKISVGVEANSTRDLMYLVGSLSSYRF